VRERAGKEARDSTGRSLQIEEEEEKEKEGQEEQ
jgi:hypothetical protein